VNNPTAPNSEQPLWQGTVSHFHYFGKWLLALILFVALCGSFFLRFPDSTVPILWGGRAALLALAIVLVLWIQLDRSRRKYAVTNKRVSTEYGIVNKSSNEVRIQDVRSINLRKTGLSGLLGIGTVEFSSAATDDADVIFWNTSDAEKVRDLVRSLQT
jgi:membrane protein YdbS with pleckstrin-like domain